MPKKIRKPPESVKPVVKIEEPAAGSNPNFFSANGIAQPTKPPIVIFKIIATHTTAAKSNLCVVITAIIAPKNPISSPFKKPFKASVMQTFGASNNSTSPIASERTVMAKVCAPVLPPMPAIMGINTASKAKCEISF